MFLLRAAFWLTLVVMFIPADPQAGVDAPRVGVFQALGAAKAAVADVSAFCTRNPDACETGGSAVRLLEMKASYGAKMLQKYISGGQDPKAKPVEGTLSTEDVDIPWHGPAAHGNA